MDRDAVVGLLADVEDPQLGDDIVSLGLVNDVTLDGDVARVSLALGAPYAPAERYGRPSASIRRHGPSPGKNVATLAPATPGSASMRRSSSLARSTKRALSSPTASLFTIVEGPSSGRILRVARRICSAGYRDSAPAITTD